MTRSMHKFAVGFHALSLVFWLWLAATCGGTWPAIMAGWSVFFGAYSLAKLREGVRA